MDRRTALKLSGLGLVAAGGVGLAAPPAPAAEVDFSGVKPLKLGRGDAAAVLSFDTPGEYVEERIFLIDGVNPAGTKEIGRLVIRSGDVEDTLAFEFVGELIVPDGAKQERRCIIDAMPDMNGHVVYLLRTSYGSHRRTYVSAIDASSCERIGSGVSGIVGEHVEIRLRSTKTDRGYDFTEWLRRTPESEWIPMSRNTLTKVG